MPKTSTQAEVVTATDHGHPHDENDDALFVILHGHAQDLADHDHHSAWLRQRVASTDARTADDRWPMPPEQLVSDHARAIERPPRG